jgi:hypothetical protein
LTRVAGSQAIAARRCLTATDEIVTVGQSAGGRLAPDFVVKAAEMGLESKGLLGISMVGLDKRPSLSTASAFVIDGFWAQHKYYRDPANTKLDRGMERFEMQMTAINFRSKHNALANDYRIFRKSPSYLMFLLARSPLADDGGFKAIERAMDSNPDLHAAFVSGGLDKVTRWHKIEPQVFKLASLYLDRFSWDVWPEDGHSMGIGSQQPRFAACVRTVIESLSN